MVGAHLVFGAGQQESPKSETTSLDFSQVTLMHPSAPNWRVTGEATRYTRIAMHGWHMYLQKW